MEGLEKKLIRIGNKCRKYGNEFSYDRVGEHFETLREKTESGVVVEHVVKFIDIEVEGKAIVNGWRFVASLEYTDKGNIVNGVGDVEVPDRYYTCQPWCEHCKTRRDRKSSYIVYNEESGEFKQVGKSCLKDFTGGLSAENVALFESYFKEIEEASESRPWGHFPVFYDVKEFMVCVAESIRLYGYVKRDGTGISTVSRADDVYSVENNLPLGSARKEILEQYDEMVARGLDTKREDSRELAGKVVDWIVNNGREDNYFHNLKVACSLEYCEGHVLGLLTSAFPAYDRELEWEAERREREIKEAEARAKSSWMGNVGDKVSFEIADFRVISSWSTQWGYTFVYKFVDSEGHEATWKTGADLDSDCIGKKITGKVKELKEFRGIKQTELTRCKVA